MDSGNLRGLLVVLAMIGLGATAIAVGVALTSYDLASKVIAITVAAGSLAVVGYVVWRDVYTLSKALSVAAMFATAAALFSLMQPGIPWPLMATLAWLAVSLWFMYRPPGWSRRHELLETMQGKVLEYDGVHFVLATPGPARLGQPVMIEGRFENCWSAKRTFVLIHAKATAEVTLEPLEVRTAQLSLPVPGQTAGRKELALDVRVLGVSGRRVKPRRAMVVNQKVATSTTVTLAFAGVVMWGGGIKVPIEIVP